MSFLIGTAAAEGIHIRLKNAEKLHWRQIILLGEMVLLLIVNFLPQALEPLANALVSFVCAMQVQTFHKVRGHAYASTMPVCTNRLAIAKIAFWIPAGIPSIRIEICIGNMRSGTEALCAYFRTREKEVLQKALTYFGVILVFGVGAGLGSILTAVVGCKAIWVCCALLSISFGLMFVPERK